jgi:hypothetical protein
MTTLTPTEIHIVVEAVRVVLRERKQADVVREDVLPVLRRWGRVDEDIVKAPAPRYDDAWHAERVRVAQDAWRKAQAAMEAAQEDRVRFHMQARLAEARRLGKRGAYAEKA